MGSVSEKRSSGGMSLYDDDDDEPIMPKKDIKTDDVSEDKVKGKLSSPEKRLSGPSLYDDESAVPAKRMRAGDAEVSSNSLGATSTGENIGTNTGPKDKQGNDSTGVVSRSKQYSMISVLAALKGERDEMQDAHLCLDNFELGPLVYRSSLYGVYDGHAGARAAKYCENLLPNIIKQKLSSFAQLELLEKSLKKTFVDSYKQIDEVFLNDARKEKPVWKDGTTATTALFINNTIYVANIGDSRAIVCRAKPEDASLVAVQLTVDHNPTVYEERIRIQKAGGIVRDGRVNGVIEVSRSIGDGQFKTIGVTCVPDLKKLTLTENDRFLIVACDGLWKSFSNDEAIRFVTEQLGKETGIESDDGELGVWQRTAHAMAAEAVRRKCGDNVSVILVKLEKVDI